jgi:hypothetical protein
MPLLKSANRYLVMADLDILLREYAQFEANVREAMTGRCAGHCRVCARVCCREELCRETVECPFLGLLRRQFSPPVTYSSEKGWLTQTGCALSAGRAPVCYHFLCSNILASQLSPSDCYMLEVLAALINHIGKFALGRRHLVEIMNADDLYRVKRSSFEAKLSEARAALNVILDYFNHGFLDDGRIAKLSRIQPLPSSRIISEVIEPKSNRI